MNLILMIWSTTNEAINFRGIYVPRWMYIESTQYEFEDYEKPRKSLGYQVKERNIFPSNVTQPF